MIGGPASAGSSNGRTGRRVSGHLAARRWKPDDVPAQVGSQLRVRQRKLADMGLARTRTGDSMQELARLTRVARCRAHSHGQSG
jgi:hypothetical protein